MYQVGQSQKIPVSVQLSLKMNVYEIVKKKKIRETEVRCLEVSMIIFWLVHQHFTRTKPSSSLLLYTDHISADD